MFGVVVVSGNVAEGLLIFAAGIVLFYLLVEGSSRRTIADRQEEILRWSLESLPAVRVVDSGGISPVISEVLDGSDMWAFRGGSGRWLRSTTLPTLATITDREVNVLIQILDPRDSDLCARYASYRAIQRKADVLRPDEADPKNIQADLLATIYAAAWHANCSRISVELVLLRQFSPLRHDLGSDGLVITLADPREQALYAASGSWLYSSMLDEMRQAKHGHGSVDLPVCPQSTTITATSGPQVEELLKGAIVIEPSGERQPLMNGSNWMNVDFDRIADRLLPSSPY